MIALARANLTCFVKYRFPLKLDVIKESLKLPFVDNIMSAHKIIMKPGHSISLAFDRNAANRPHIISLLYQVIK
jgi:hypothetical protein